VRGPDSEAAKEEERVTIAELVKEILEWIYHLWPIRLVNEWEQGILVRSGTIVRTLNHDDGILKSGFHAYLPFRDSILTEDANIDILDTDYQALTTNDGVRITVSAMMRFRIVALDRFYRKIQDPTNTLQNAMQAAVSRAVPHLTWYAEDESEDVPRPEFGFELCTELESEIADDADDWGIHVLAVDIANLTDAQILRVLTDGE